MTELSGTMRTVGVKANRRVDGYGATPDEVVAGRSSVTVATLVLIVAAVSLLVLLLGVLALWSMDLFDAPRMDLNGSAVAERDDGTHETGSAQDRWLPAYAR